MRELLDGERDEAALCESLDLESAMIVMAILQYLLSDDADELSDLPAQLQDAGYTVLANLLDQMQAGDEDVEKLTTELDDQERAIFTAILWLLEDPERLRTVQQDS